MENYEKTGYLQNDFRIFHLNDMKKMEFSYHYHDFDKIVLFLSGDVTYSIEGRKYELKPMILFLSMQEKYIVLSFTAAIPMKGLSSMFLPDLCRNIKMRAMI